MYRALTIAAAAASLMPVGCASMWDAVTSRNFRDAPFKTVGKVISPDDPVVVLRADPPRSGDERAKAMHRLKEPIRNKGTQQDQDQMVELLERAATADPSPVVRYAAVDALGRFEDERVPRILMIAFQKADGRPEGAAAPPPPRTDNAIILTAGMSAGRAPTKPGMEPPSLKQPVGYAPDTAAALRSRCLESLGQTSRLEAARFLAAVAGASGPDVKPPGSDDPEVRLAAVRSLGQCRQPEAVIALATVLTIESTNSDKVGEPMNARTAHPNLVEEDGVDSPRARHAVFVRTAHQGLVRLTGKKLPPDPQKWDEVVQAGATVAPKPTWVENTVQNAVFWEKK